MDSEIKKNLKNCGSSIQWLDILQNNSLWEWNDNIVQNSTESME